MALMQKPADVDPENITEADMVLALDEDGDVEQKNTEYSDIAAYVKDQVRRFKDHRTVDEERWLMPYRNYRGR
tara:strand:- start:184 stop:402 length:219 start_codon:yes stop_codon:yes gene_type:complete